MVGFHYVSLWYLLPIIHLILMICTHNSTFSWWCSKASLLYCTCIPNESRLDSPPVSHSQIYLNRSCPGKGGLWCLWRKKVFNLLFGVGYICAAWCRWGFYASKSIVQRGVVIARDDWSLRLQSYTLCLIAIVPVFVSRVELSKVLIFVVIFIYLFFKTIVETFCIVPPW